MGRDVVRTASGEVDAAGEVLTGNRLLVDRTRNGDGGRLQLLDLVADRTQRIHAGTGGILHGADLLGDFFSRAAGLRGQFLDFACHHRKSTARFTATRRLDRSIEREQVGAFRDGLDQFHNLADLFGRRGEGGDRLVGVSCIIGSLACQFGRMRRLAADFADRHGKFVRCSSGSRDAARRLFHGAADFGSLDRGQFCRGRHFFGCAVKLAGSSRDARDDFADFVLERSGQLRDVALAAFGGLLAACEQLVELVTRLEEYFEGPGKIADFVLTYSAGDGDIAIALGEGIHSGGDCLQRTDRVENHTTGRKISQHEADNRDEDDKPAHEGLCGIAAKADVGEHRDQESADHGCKHGEFHLVREVLRIEPPRQPVAVFFHFRRLVRKADTRDLVGQIFVEIADGVHGYPSAEHLVVTRQALDMVNVDLLAPVLL